jgi:hypothetical protein
MKTKTKMALLLTTLAALSTVSRASFAQDFITYSSSYGRANATVATVAPVNGGISATDWGFQSAPRQHHSRSGR